MARTQITAQTLPLQSNASFYPATPLTATSADLVFTAGDAVNSNYAALVSGKTVLQVKNVHTTTAFTITIHSVADAQNRTGDITSYSVTALTTSNFGPFTTQGWAQSSPAGLWFDPASSNLTIAVLTLP